MFDLAINPRVFKNWRHLLAFGFGSGLARKAPGTWGTLASMPLCCALWLCLPSSVFVVVLFAMAVLGVMICGSVAEDIGEHDHGGIVWDEWVGYGITLLGLPLVWYWPVLAFIFFRLFDIWKPWPISVCDKKIHGGTGIMLDDMVAGLFACFVLHALRIGLGL